MDDTHVATILAARAAPVVEPAVYLERSLGKQIQRKNAKNEKFTSENREANFGPTVPGAPSTSVQRRTPSPSGTTALKREAARRSATLIWSYQSWRGLPQPQRATGSSLPGKSKSIRAIKLSVHITSV
jgi:hypothetical protein